MTTDPVTRGLRLITDRADPGVGPLRTVKAPHLVSSNILPSAKLWQAWHKRLSVVTR
jgi:hypothetical protein